MYFSLAMTGIVRNQDVPFANHHILIDWKYIIESTSQYWYILSRFNVSNYNECLILNRRNTEGN